MNTDKEEGEELLEVFGQVADVSLELATALDQHGFAREHSGDEDPASSLKTALILLAPVRRAAPADE